MSDLPSTVTDDTIKVRQLSHYQFSWVAGESGANGTYTLQHVLDQGAWEEVLTLSADDAPRQGRDFSIAQLIQDKVAARPWANGAVASFRLSPQDYHRYHSPVRGTVKWWKELDGDYYSVRPSRPPLHDPG